MDDINDVRLAWIRRRMTIQGNELSDSFGNDGAIRVFKKLDDGLSSFTRKDLARSVSSLAVDKRWEDIDGFGVTRPNFVSHTKPEDLIKIADLVDAWMLGL